MTLRRTLLWSQHDAVTVLRDESTGLEIELSRADGERLQAAQGSDVEHLRSIGLTADLDDAEARRRQATWLRGQAIESIFPALQEQLKWASENTRFHARLVGALPATVDALYDLPTMSRDDLRREFPDGLVAPQLDLSDALANGRLIAATSSGTSGERLQTVSDRRIPRLPAEHARLMGLPDLPEGEAARTAVFTSPVCAGPTCHLGQVPMEQRIELNTLFLNSTPDPFSMSDGLVTNVLDELNAFRPQLLFVNPAYLVLLLRHAARIGRSLPSVQAVLTSYQLLMRRHRAVITQALRCPVLGFYTATELSGNAIGTECRYGAMHARFDHGLVELLDESGRPLRSGGEVGRVAVTTFNRWVPLVRYLVGDLAEWVDTPCPCEVGSQWPTLRLHGRARDSLRRNGRWITPVDVDMALEAAPGADFFQVLETEGAFECALTGAADEALVRPPLEQLLGGKVALRHVERMRPDLGQKFRVMVPRQPTPA